MNNHEHCSNAPSWFHTGAHSRKSLMALSFPGPTACFSLHIPLLCHMKPAAMLFTCSPPQSSSTLLVFFIVYPLLRVSVCLSVLFLPLAPPPPPYDPIPFLSITSPNPSNLPPPLQPRAPSPTSPDEFPMNVKQAYKAFAAVPRSLAVLEPPQVGHAARAPPGHNNRKHAVLIGWSRPPAPS